MHLYSNSEAYAHPAPAPAPTQAAPGRALSGTSNDDPLSFVVDLNDLGLRDAYKAHEIHRGSQCPIFAKVGPEYVNPWSGAREQARWIL